jgi:hypothetical protein
MIRIDFEPGESRLQYLARVLVAYMDFFEPGLIHYDGAECDGQCLADDIESAVESLPDLEDLKKAVNYFDAGGEVDARSEYLIKAARKLIK